MVNHHKRLSSQSGFTLLELVIVVSILAVIAGASFLFLGGSVGTRTLEAAERDLVSMLREAQSNALGRVKDASWGVRVWNSPTGAPCNQSGNASSCAELFWSTATPLVYSGANVTRLFVFSSRVDLSQPGESGVLDIIFEEQSGKLIGSFGEPWVGFIDNTNSRFRVARYLGGAITGDCTGAQGNLWDCMEVDGMNAVGLASSLAISYSHGAIVSLYRIGNSSVIRSISIGTEGGISVQ